MYNTSLFDKLAWVKGCLDRDGDDDFSYSIEKDFGTTPRDILLEHLVLKVIEDARKPTHVTCFKRVVDTLAKKKFISAGSMKKLIAKLTPRADEIAELFDLPNKTILLSIFSTFA